MELNNDGPERLGITIAREVLEQWVLRDLSDAEVREIERAMEHSTVPEALMVIADSIATHLRDPENPALTLCFMGIRGNGLRVTDDHGQLTCPACMDNGRDMDEIEPGSASDTPYTPPSLQ